MLLVLVVAVLLLRVTFELPIYFFNATTQTSLDKCPNHVKIKTLELLLKQLGPLLDPLGSARRPRVDRFSVLRPTFE